MGAQLGAGGDDSAGEDFVGEAGGATAGTAGTAGGRGRESDAGGERRGRRGAHHRNDYAGFDLAGDAGAVGSGLAEPDTVTVLEKTGTGVPCPYAECHGLEFPRSLDAKSLGTKIHTYITKTY